MELSPCTALRHLSLANVRMSADPTFMKCEVEVVATSYMGRTNKLAALFAIIFRRSACQHPLLAGALGAPMTHWHSCIVQGLSSSPALAV